MSIGSGSNCTELTKDLELGEVKSQELLPEYQEQNQITLLQEDNLWH